MLYVKDLQFMGKIVTITIIFSRRVINFISMCVQTQGLEQTRPSLLSVFVGETLNVIYEIYTGIEE